MIGIAVPLLFLLLIGCPPPYEPKKLEMEPIGTTKNVPTTTADDPSDGGVVAPNSGTTAQNTDTPGGSSICSGSFDDLADTLKSCEVSMPKGTEPLKGKLEVKVTGGGATTPGGHVELQVTLRNTSSEPLNVYFTGDPSPHFDVEATDSKGKRVDLPPGRWPGYPKGFKPDAKEAKAAKVTLAKDGTAKLKVTWDAVKMKWAPERAKTWDGRGFPRSPDKPLGKGKYSLRVILPIMGDVEVPKVTIEVS
ncbi:MAG: hypothetical protein U0270_26355 [Labilithrix sp.]